MHRHDVGLREQVVERVGGVVRVGIVRDHTHAEPLEAPLRGASHRTEPDDADRLARELPRPVPLVGEHAVAVGVTGADVGVGRHDAACHREEQPDGELGDRVGVASRRAEHGNALRRGRGDVDVVGVAATGADREQRQLEHRARDEVGLHDEEVGALGLHPLRELLTVVEPYRLLVDPGVEHDVGQGLEGREALATEGSGHERSVIGHRA